MGTRRINVVAEVRKEQFFAFGGLRESQCTGRSKCISLEARKPHIFLSLIHCPVICTAAISKNLAPEAGYIELPPEQSMDKTDTSLVLSL